MTQGILFYQLVILAIILVAARFGESALKRVTIAVVIFTFTHVFMPWLMVLQFGTIFLGYRLGKSIIRDPAEKDKSFPDNESKHEPEPSTPSATFINPHGYLDVCGRIESDERVSESNARAEYSKHQRHKEPKQGSTMTFSNFKEASEYAKNNPGLKITRDGNGRYIVTK